MQRRVVNTFETELSHTWTTVTYTLQKLLLRTKTEGHTKSQCTIPGRSSIAVHMHGVPARVALCQTQPASTDPQESTAEPLSHGGDDHTF